MNREALYSLLDIVVGDARDGVDIISRYPRFYAAMLADERLHQCFIDALALCEAHDEDAGRDLTGRGATGR